MKRLISIILVITLFSSLTIVSASEKGQKTAATNEAIAFFEDFMIFDHSKDEHEAMSRGEFAQIIFNILNYQNSAFNLPSGNIIVEDINEAGSYKDAVSTMVQMGYMQGEVLGNNSYRFSPNRPITVIEIVKVLVDLLGYKELISYTGGYPNGYLTVANTLKITKDMPLSIYNSATVAIAKTLVYNALNAEVAVLGISNNNLYIKNETGRTYISERWNLKMVEGVLKANSILHITGQATTRGEYVNIDDVLYPSDNTYKNFAYIGRYVRAYVDVSEGKEGNIVSIFPLDGKGEAFTIAVKDVVDWKSLEQITVESEERELSYDISEDAGVYYNFEYLGPVRAIDFSLEEIQEKMQLLGSDASGDIILVDHNNDGHADFVWIRNFRNILLKNFIYEDFKLEDVYSNSLEMRQAFDKDKLVFMDTEGKLFNPKNFEKDDVVSIIVDTDSSGEIQRAFGIVSKTTVRGKIDEISDEGVLINNVFYKPSPEYLELLQNNSQKVEELELGLETLFYMNAFNMIVGINKNELVQENEEHVGFLYKISKARGLNGQASALLYNIDGENTIIEFNDSVRINGEVKKGSEVFDRINDFAELQGGENSVIYRLVKYQLKDDKIASLDIYAYHTKEYNDANGSPEPERDAKLYPRIFMDSSEPSANTVFKASTIGKRVGITNNTAILAVPSLEHELDFDSLDDYAFYSVSYNDMDGDSIFGDPGYSSTANTSGISDNPLQMAFYDVDETLFAGIAIRYYKYVSGGINVSNPELLDDVVVVEKIVNGINEEGEKIAIIYGYQKGAPVKLPTEPVEDMGQLWSRFPALQYQLKAPGKEAVSAGHILKGDVIQVLLNTKGEVINALVLMRAADANNPAWLINTPPPGTNLSRLNQGQGNQYLGVNFGTIVEYSDGKLILDELDGVRRVYLLGNTTVTEYNRTNGKVSKGSVQNLEIGKQIFIRQYYSGIREAVYYVD